jgi:hypothetical protein
LGFAPGFSNAESPNINRHHMTPPVLNALKPYKEQFNVKYDLDLPTDTPFGNLTLSWATIVIRFECVNDLVVQLYKEFFELKEKIKIIPWSDKNEIYKQKVYTEQLFYWLRKSADEIISIIFLLNYYQTHKGYPSKIKISSIGELLHTKNDIYDYLEKHQPFLKTLNDVSNGFKHSFLNSQIHAFHGSEYPVVFALVMKHNTLTSEPKFHTLDLKQVLNDYNNFLIDIKEIIQNNYGIKHFRVS